MEPKETICYAVRDWNAHFENSESRKIKSLTWVPVKNKHDGKGYRRLCQHPRSVQVFCAWNLIIQVASKMPTRGLLADGDGPLTTSDLSDKTGFPVAIFEEAFRVLSDPKIAWLAVIDTPNLPASTDAPGLNGREQKGTEGNKEESAGALPAASGELKLQSPLPDAKKPTDSDEAWRKALAANAAYRGVNVEVEFGKMNAWCEVNRKMPSRRRFLNWLNRAERPMEPGRGPAQIPAIDKVLLKRNLDDLEAKLRRLIEQYDGHQSWTAGDLAERKRLRGLIAELKTKLGMVG